MHCIKPWKLCDSYSIYLCLWVFTCKSQRVIDRTEVDKIDWLQCSQLWEGCFPNPPGFLPFPQTLKHGQAFSEKTGNLVLKDPRLCSAVSRPPWSLLLVTCSLQAHWEHTEQNKRGGCWESAVSYEIRTSPLPARHSLAPSLSLILLFASLFFSLASPLTA